MEEVKGNLEWVSSFIVKERKYANLLCRIFKHQIGWFKTEIRLINSDGERDWRQVYQQKWCLRCGKLLGEYDITPISWIERGRWVGG